jgi:predicted ATP-grasp superfamily ATP-dependent carboligase
MSTGDPLAVVMGDIDLVRPLALAGIPCAVFAPASDPVHRSRHVRERVPWANPWEHEQAAAEALLTFGRESDRPPVLLPQSDGDLLLVSRHRARLGERFRFALADADLVETLADKARFSQLAERVGLPVPRACRISAADGRPEDLDLRFPLIVKPLNRSGASWLPVGAKAKAVHVDSPAALAKLWPHLAELRLDVLAQEAVAGPEAHIESYHAYIDAEGTVVGEYTGRKIRTFPTRYGHSTSIEITSAPEVAEVGRDVLATVGLRGVAKVDFKRDGDGKLLLFEINPRFNLWHHPGALAGVNLPALVYADLTGRPRPRVLPARPGVRWCLPVRDLQAFRAGGGNVVAWARWASHCDAISGLARDDPMPLVAGTFGTIARNRLRRLAGRPAAA